MSSLLCSHVAFEFKLKEVVGDLCSTLTREDKHLIPTYGYWEVTTGGWDFTALFNLKETKKVVHQKQVIMHFIR